MYIVNNNKFIGITLAICASLSLAILGECVKNVSEVVPESLIIFSRFLFCMLFFIPFLFRDKSFTFKVVNMWGLIIRAFSGFLAMVLFFIALRSMLSVNALLLVNTSPVFVPFILYFLTGQKTSFIVMFGIILSVFGVSIILMPEFGNFNIYAIYGIAAGFFGAVATVLLRTIGKYNSPNQMMFYYFLYGILFSLIMVIIEWVSISVVDLYQLIIIGVFGLFFQFALTYSLYITKVRIVAPIMLTSIIFGSIFDWFFRNSIPNFHLLAGGIILTIGIVVVVYFLKD